MPWTAETAVQYAHIVQSFCEKQQRYDVVRRKRACAPARASFTNQPGQRACEPTLSAQLLSTPARVRQLAGCAGQDARGDARPAAAQTRTRGWKQDCRYCTALPHPVQLPHWCCMSECQPGNTYRRHHAQHLGHLRITMAGAEAVSSRSQLAGPNADNSGTCAFKAGSDTARNRQPIAVRARGGVSQNVTRQQLNSQGCRHAEQTTGLEWRDRGARLTSTRWTMFIVSLALRPDER